MATHDKSRDHVEASSIVIPAEATPASPGAREPEPSNPQRVE
jgi:hypothetical protein